jgi:ATP-dependent DNA ligase
MQSKAVSAESMRMIVDTEKHIAKCLQSLEQQPGSETSQRRFGAAARKAGAAKFTHRDFMLASPSSKPFDRSGWIFEFKYDGLRVLAIHDKGRARLLSKKGVDVAPAFPEIVEALLALPPLVADGELVVLDEQGKPQFETVRGRSLMRKPTSARDAARRAPADLLAFDILEIGGKELRSLPLLKRKKVLQDALEGSLRVRPMQYVHEQGKQLYGAARALGMDGIIAKRANAPYTAGRSSDWLKIGTPPGSVTQAVPIEAVNGQ